MATKKATKKEETTTAAEATTETGLVAQAAAGLPAVPGLAAWGKKPVDVRNIVIARILPQQPMSKFVTEGKAMIGDMIESSNGTKIGDLKTPLEFIPFHQVENWIIFEEKNGAMKFAKIVPCDASNTNWLLEEVVNGVKIKRDRVLEYYVLLPSDLAKGVKRPYVMSFRRTSMKAGKKLYTTMFVTNAANGLTPAATVCSLTGTKTTNDKGTFIVMDVTEGRKSTEAEQVAAFEWYQTVVSSKDIKVDDSAIETEERAFVAPTGPAQF